MFVAITGGLFALIWRGFALKQTLHNRHKGDRAATKSAIESRFLIPRLADLVFQISSSIPPHDPENEDSETYRHRVLLELQRVARISDIEDVSEYHSDYAAVTDLEHSMGRWGSTSAWAGLAALPGVVYLGLSMAWTDMPVSATLQWGSAILVGIGVTAIALSRLQERQLGNELIDLYQRYELPGED